MFSKAGIKCNNDLEFTLLRLALCLAAAALFPAAPIACGKVTFTGDSAEVVRMLHHSSPTTDLFLFNCSEVVTDVLQGWEVTSIWAPQEVNALCENLAVQTRVLGNLSLEAVRHWHDSLALGPLVCCCR